MERKETIIIDLEVDIEDSVESINSLTKANKALRDERNKLNLQTESGKKRAAEINALLDENTNKIKTNVSALEKQRLNIGNYASALDNVIPGLSSFIEKGTTATKTVTGMSTATKLLLGPIGLLILAGTAIVKWLTGSEEGMDKLAIIMAKVGAVVNVVTDRIMQLGGALVKFLSGDFSGGIDGIKNSFAGMGDEMSREIALAVDLAERLDILDDLNLALEIRLSEQENKIKNLIIQSKNRALSEEQRMKKLVQAAALEKQLTGEQIALRLAEVNIIASEIQLRNSEKQAVQQAGETTIEFAKRIAADNRILLADRQKIGDQLKQYNGLLGNQANIQEKISSQQDVLSDKIAENLKEAQALEEANRRAQNISASPSEDPLIGAFQTRANVIQDIDKRMNDELVARNKETDLEIIRSKRRAAEIEADLERTKLAIIANTLGQAANLFEEDTEGFKIFASAQALMNTYLASTAALASGSKINPIFGIISAGLAVLNGLAAVAQINNVEFAEGGWTGPGHRTKPVGVVHADEYVTPKWLVNNRRAQPHIAALETMRVRGYQDGGLVSNSITGPINERMELMNMMKSLGPFEISAVEMTKAQRRVHVKERISKR